MPNQSQFDDVCLRYIANARHIRDVTERVDLIVDKILNEISQRLGKKRQLVESRHGNVVLSDRSYDDWTRVIELKRKKESAPIMALGYGFNYVDDIRQQRINDAAMHFVTWTYVEKKPNDLANVTELRAYWQHVLRPMFAKEGYVIPVLGKGDEPYAYRNIYAIHPQGIQSVYYRKGHLAYVDAVSEAFKYEFKKSRVNMYLGLRAKVKQWKKTLKK